MYKLRVKYVQVAQVARLEHLSDAVVHLESFIGTPMESDPTFKAYSGTNSSYALLRHVRITESEPYCHSILFVCLSVGHSATYSLPRLIDQNQIWSARVRGQVYTCPRTCVSLFGSRLPYFGCQREKYAKFRLFPTCILATANVTHRAIWLVFIVYVIVVQYSLLRCLFLLFHINGAECCDERVCLWVSVCLQGYFKNQEVWCMLPMVVAWFFSGGIAIHYVLPSFVDGIMFSCNGRYGGVMLPQQACFSAVCIIIPLLRVWYWLFYPRWQQAPRLDESFVHGFHVEYAMHSCVVQQVLPKVIWEEPRRHPSQQRMDLPTACAMQYPLQTSPVTELWVRHIHTAVPVPHST